MQPRLIRLRDAPNYLGMDRNRFNKEVRPFLTTLKIGQQGVAFDRLDLDDWVDEFKTRQGLSPQQIQHGWPLNLKSLKSKNKSSTRLTKKTDEEKFKQFVDHVLKKNK